MRTQKQLKKIAQDTALLVHTLLTRDEVMDGDETEYLAQEFLNELDELNANM